MNTLTTSVSKLTRENENRTLEISGIAKIIGLPGPIEAHNLTTDDRSEDDVELREVERCRRRNEEVIRNTPNPNENPTRNQTNMTLIQSELISAKEILGTIEILN